MEMLCGFFLYKLKSPTFLEQCQIIAFGYPRFPVVNLFAEIFVFFVKMKSVLSWFFEWIFTIE